MLGSVAEAEDVVQDAWLRWRSVDSEEVRHPPSFLARPRYPVARDEGEAIAQAFHAASSQGDLASLRTILADTVVLQSDGGGKANAFLKPIIGLEKVVRMFAGILRKFAATPSVFVQWTWIDGLPGFISYERDGSLQTTALEIEDGRVRAIYIIRNPDKLGGAARH